MARVFVRRIRQAEEDHGSITHEARDETMGADCLLIDEAVKLLQQRTSFVGSEPLAQPGEAGQIHEYDGCLLADGLVKKLRITREALRQARRLKAAQDSALDSQRIGATAVEPQASRSKNHGWGKCGHQGKCCTEPNAIHEGP